MENRKKDEMIYRIINWIIGLFIKPKEIYKYNVNRYNDEPTATGIYGILYNNNSTDSSATNAPYNRYTTCDGYYEVQETAVTDGGYEPIIYYNDYAPDYKEYKEKNNILRLKLLPVAMGRIQKQAICFRR